MRKPICLGILGGCGLVLLVLGALTAGYFDSLVNYTVSKELVLRNGTDVYKKWQLPPVVPHLNIYFFNLTNTREFLQGGEKPRLQQVGPYCYRERWEKVNVSFHHNGTVTYETQKYYWFDRSLSSGPESDIISTLNIPMVSAVSQWRFSARLAKLALSSMLEVLNEKPIVSHTVKELLWGYEDPLLKIAKDILPPESRLPYDKFGFFYERNGSTDGLLNVFTGETGMSKYTTIDWFQYQKELSYWTTDECNRILGTDGSSFPPGVTPNTTLYMFNSNLCRSIPLTFWHHTQDFGVTGMRFSPPADVFAKVSVKPENKCYCVGGPPCIGGGVFNISSCKFGSPTIVSWPHFYQADPQYRDAVIGMTPDPEKHALFIDVAPLTGVPLRAQARIQINIAVPHVPEVKPAAMLREMIYPVLWFEDGVTELPEDLVDLLQLAENVPGVVRRSLVMAFFIAGTVLVVGVGLTLLIQHLDLPVPYLNSAYTHKDGRVTKVDPAVAHGRPELTGHTNVMVSEEPENDTA